MGIEWLLNKLKERFYPVTHADAVLCGTNADKTLTDKLNELENGTIIVSKAVDADTLDGKHSNEFAASNHTHDSMNTHIADTTVHVTTAEKNAWNGKANASHGNHVPATQTASRDTFLRNDNAWQKITPSDIGAAATSHNHTKSEITDFPTSLPASDVSAWAKASAKPSYTWNEIGSKPTSFTPASHNQDASTITAGTLAGKVQANATAAATVTDAQVRDIYAGTTDMTAGTSDLVSGDIYIMYE